jgi:hypothetical protein
MRTNHVATTAALLLLSAVLTPLCAEAPQGGPSGAVDQAASEPLSGRRLWANRMRPSEHTLSAQFQATVYEVRAPAERIAGFEERSLTDHAATADALLTALARTGEARVLYRTDQPVNVFSTMTTIGSSEPVVTGSRTTVATNRINSIGYQNVGLVVRLSAQPPPRGESNPAPNVNMAVKLSVLYPGENELAPGQKETVARSVTLGHSEVLAFNRPRVLLAISSNVLSLARVSTKRGANAEKSAAPIAYVIRYQFGSPLGGRDSATAAGTSAIGASDSLPAVTMTKDPETGETNSTLTVRFRATVYQVAAPTNGLPALRLEEVAAAATPELALKALAGSGESTVLYHLDQPVNVFSDTAQVVTNEPLTTTTRNDPAGAPVASYTYHKMGVRVTFSAKAQPKDVGRQGPDVWMALNLSADASRKADLATGRSAAAFCTIAQEHNEPLELGRPRALLAAGSPSAAKEARPFVYVVRYQFDLPESK